MKKMKSSRVLVILCAVFFALGLPLVASANSPEKVDAFYNFNTKTLMVKVTHPTKNADKHFVSEVVVKKNGVVVQRAVYNKQDGDTPTYSYIMPATVDDVFEITATCSIHGSKTVKYQPGV
ncbi:MAG TPA: hypothetical protein VMB77_01685 [Syntrophales bacterium]|nr:hypothetical protein [Syntrophales bacterium]